MTPGGRSGPPAAVTSVGPGPRRTLRVGVNLLWLVPGVVGGSEEYTTGLLRALADACPGDLHVTLFTLAQFPEAHPDLVASYATVTASIDGRSRPRRVLAEATWLPKMARQRHVDLLHHAGGVVPPGPGIARIPSVLTIHDLQPLVLPEHFSAVKRRWMAAMLPRSAARARLVITPSPTTSASVVERLGVASSRVRVVSRGVEAFDAPAADRLAAIDERYRLGSPVVLYPAITYPHKDHRTLVDAFALLARTRPDATLVLTGGAGQNEAEVTAAIRASGVGDQVRRTGRVPTADLRALYARADVVAVPSRFEGFGLPALEAMAAGVPLVAARATALPWVADDAALLVEPGDPVGWADALARVLDDPTLAADLRRRGLARAAGFGWDRSADALAAAYRDASGMGEDGAR